ncbi:hypothetical protein GCM10009844_15660 [Nocardioides koreensis]|uniref:Uncharacterized protein n=1 Tax=Nocardioides koreensis TaxID=433651 RepID=A0ABN2ZJT9_9ACTN
MKVFQGCPDCCSTCGTLVPLGLRPAEDDSDLANPRTPRCCARNHVRVFRGLSERAARRRAAREMHRRLAELDRLDRTHGLGTMPTSSNRRRARREHGAFWPSMFVTLVVLVAVLALTPGVSAYRIRALVGLGDHRLHDVVSTHHGQGQFRFTKTQPGSQEPVSYNPCRPIHYVVNPTGRLPTTCP